MQLPPDEAEATVKPKDRKAIELELFPDGFEQRLLWQDPIAPDPTTYYGAVLRAEEISDYVTRYNLLINHDDFRPENLKGASYTMSPHRSEAWIISDDGKHLALKVQNNSRGPYYQVPRNSLVYIRLHELLRLPFYFIGRHNLKIDYVYQGLLLGTGPQVDPGYIGRIYIPLHNLTNQEVEIYINESFVSIDFVRTGPLQLEDDVPQTYDGFYARYKTTKRPIHPDKVFRKTDLPTYLQGSKPSSSLGRLVTRFETMDSAIAGRLRDVDSTVEKYQENIAKDLRGRRYIEFGGGLAGLGLLMAFFFYFNAQLSTKTELRVKDVSELRESVTALRMSVADSEARIRSEIDAAQIAKLRADLQKLASDLETLRKEIEKGRTSGFDQKRPARP